ncbi:MAG: hypothetical protein WC451_05615 [Patescibacteria group bacterium]
MKRFTLIIDWILRIIGFLTFATIDLNQILPNYKVMNVGIIIHIVLFGILGLVLVWIFQYLFKISMYKNIDLYLEKKESFIISLRDEINNREKSLRDEIYLTAQLSSIRNINTLIYDLENKIGFSSFDNKEHPLYDVLKKELNDRLNKEWEQIIEKVPNSELKHKTTEDIKEMLSKHYPEKYIKSNKMIN